MIAFPPSSSCYIQRRWSRDRQRCRERWWRPATESTSFSWVRCHILPCSHSDTPVPVPQNEVQNVQMQLGVAGSKSFTTFSELATVALELHKPVLTRYFSLLIFFTCSNGYTPPLQMQGDLCRPCCKLSPTLSHNTHSSVYTTHCPHYTDCSSSEFTTTHTHILSVHVSTVHVDYGGSSGCVVQGPVWALCVAGDMLFSASSDNTIKVGGNFCLSCPRFFHPSLLPPLSPTLSVTYIHTYIHFKDLYCYGVLLFFVTVPSCRCGTPLVSSAWTLWQDMME